MLFYDDHRKLSCWGVSIFLGASIIIYNNKSSFSFYRLFCTIITFHHVQMYIICTNHDTAFYKRI